AQMNRFELEREPKGELERAGRVLGAGIEVVTIFKANGANNSAPAHAAADGEQAGIERIMVHPAGEAEGIGEKDERPFGSEGLFEFDGAEGVGLGTNDLALGIARRGIAFAIAADGVVAPGEESAVKGLVIGGAAEGDKVTDAGNGVVE